MNLRTFLYLDTSTVTDYLATLEGYDVDGSIEQVEVEKKGKGGKAGYKILEAEGSIERSTETKRKLAVTDAAKFQKLYDLLEQQNLIQFLDAYDEEIWNQIRRGELLEIEADIRLPESFELTQSMENMSPLLDVMKALGENPLADAESRTAFVGMQAISKLSEGKPIPLLFEAPSTPSFQFTCSLPRHYLRCELSELQGETTVLGKVRRILKKGQQFEVFSLLPSFVTGLPSMSKTQEMDMQRSLVDGKLADMIYGPAIVLTPIAIYR